jgi:hypothetical protein
VCQICGRPVVAVEYTVYGGCFRPYPTAINGHEFDRNGRLVSVRCAEHWNGIQPNSRELNRPPTPEELTLAVKIRFGSKLVLD